MRIAVLVIFASFLSGCASWEHVPLSTADANYFKLKIEAALPGENHVDTIYLRGKGPKKEVHIALRAKAIVDSIDEPNIEAEADCLKVIKAMSGDSLIPADEIFITSSRLMAKPYSVTGIKNTEGSTSLFSSAFYHYKTAAGIESTPTPFPENTHEILFSCRITKDGLLKGEDPEVLHRNGVRTSGVSKGMKIRYISDITY